MICPECSGNGFIKLATTNSLEASQLSFTDLAEIDCPTCEGQGELSDDPALKHCPACGEPLEVGQAWCNEHKLAELWEVS